jgi:hypothetical protein
MSKVHFMVRIGVQQVAAGAVLDALRLAGGTGGVEQEQGMLGIDPFRFADVGLAGADIVPPLVAAGHHVAGTAGALEDDDGLDRLAAAHGDAVVDRGLQRNVLAAAALLVGGDHGNRAGILDALLHALGGEAAEHHRVDRADAGAGLHGDHAFDRHRHVDQDAVALLDALRTQRIGELRNTAQQFLVGHLADLAAVGFENDGDLVAEAGFDVAVEAVVGNIQLAIGKPLVERCIGLVERLGEGLLPRHVLFGQARPIAGVVLFGFLAQRLIGGHAGNGGLLDHGIRGGEYTTFRDN